MGKNGVVFDFWATGIMAMILTAFWPMIFHAYVGTQIFDILIASVGYGLTMVLWIYHGHYLSRLMEE